jgi:hypothetical protein
MMITGSDIELLFSAARLRIEALDRWYAGLR